MEPLYRVLGLPTSASEASVKAAYRRLALDLHPDKHPGDKQREQLFHMVTFAYQTIVDPDKAAQYISGGSNASHLGAMAEAEQRRAADSVWHVVVHCSVGRSAAVPDVRVCCRPTVHCVAAVLL